MGNVAERLRFNETVAPTLAQRVSKQAALVAPAKASTRFAYFETGDDFLIVGGLQEESDCDLALAYGLSMRKDRQLILVLPREYALATEQRAAFITRDARPKMWVHDVPIGGVAPDSVERRQAMRPEDALAQLKSHLGSQSPEAELYVAATPTHLGSGSSRVAELVEWATEHNALDPAHRRGERSWHCMGQRVLSVRGTTGKGVEVRAGIHFSAEGSAPVARSLGPGDTLTAAAFKAIRDEVEEGIQERLHGSFHKPDEHWLQAVIRRRPELVGVEQPALRELPAWRPIGGKRLWGRGFIDLIGLDGQGDIRIVETKLAKNRDELLMFQGLDYYVWSRVYESALRSRLGAPRRAELVVHYVLGADPTTGEDHVSPYAGPQAAVMTIPWRFQVVSQWFEAPPEQRSATRTRVLPPGQLPKKSVQSPAGSD